MPTPILPTVEITPGSTGAWTDVDVSAYVPANAVGVAVRIYGTNGSGRAIGLRKNGSTDNRTTNLAPNRQWMGLAGLDANQVLEAYVGGTDVDLYLVGYWTSDEAVFLTNAVDVSLGSTGAWLDVDISGSTASDTALAALIEVDTSSANQGYGVRQNGSTDTLLQGGTTSIYHGWVCVGVDGAEIFEGNIESTGVDFFLIGYLTAAVTWNTNAIDRQTGTTGSYEAVAAPNAAAVMAEYTFYPDSATALVDIREKGGSVTLQQNVVVGQQAYLMTGLDPVDHQAEQYTASAGIDCWELCWFAESPTGGSDHNENAVGAGLTLSAGTTTQNFDFQETAVGAGLTLSAGTVSADTGDFEPVGVDFDGSTYLERGAALDTIADASSGTLVLWVASAEDSVVGDEKGIFTADNGSIVVAKTFGNNLIIRVSSGVSTMSWGAATDLLVSDGFVCFMISWDTSAATTGGKIKHTYRGDTEDNQDSSTPMASFSANFDGATNWFIANSADEGDVATSCIAEIIFIPGQLYDFSIEANRRIFFNADGTPADPTAVLGDAAIYLSHRNGAAVSDFLTNRGYGGNFSVAAGALAECEKPLNMFAGAGLPVGMQLTLSAGVTTQSIGLQQSVTGAALTLSAGTTQQEFDFQLALTGAGLVLSAGTVGTQGDGELLVGAGLTLLAGQVTTTFSGQVTPIGQGLTLSAGLVAAGGDIDVVLVGRGLTLSSGIVSVQFNQMTELLGMELILSAGRVRLGPLDIQPQFGSIYSDIDPSETPFYQDIQP